MTKTNHPLTTQCQSFAALLPVLEKPETDANARAQAHAHLATCGYCRAQRSAYQQMEEEAHCYLSPPAIPRYQTEEILRDLFPEMMTKEATTPTPSRSLPIPRREPRSLHRVFSGLGSLAAVLVIVALAVALFANHTRPAGNSGNLAPPWSATATELLDLSMVSATEGWAAGFIEHCTANFDACQPTGPLVMHYHNGKWSAPIFPLKLPLYNQELASISMVSATDGWASGSQGLMLHYDGQTWQQVPNPNHWSLTRIHMLSDTDGWAVGSGSHGYAILHYDGQTWAAQSLPASLGTPPNLILTGLAMISPTEGWVVGTLYGSSTPSAQTDPTAVILHYASGQWMVQSSTSKALRDSISLSSAMDGWAVGSAGTYAPNDTQNPPTGENSHAFLLHYTAGKWTEESTATLTTTWGSATSVSMDSASDGWAIGPAISAEKNGPLTTYLLHYNGHQWTPVPALAFPQNQHKLVALYRLQMLSATDGWAVGFLQTGNGQTLSNGEAVTHALTAVIVHFHNGTWSIIPTP